MRPRWRLFLAPAMMLALLALVVSEYPPPEAHAAISVVPPAAVTNPDAALINVDALETVAAGPLTVQVGNGSQGTLLLSTCSVQTAPTNCGTPTITSNGSSQLTIDDADNLIAPAGDTLHLQFTWLPPTVGVQANVTIYACQDLATPCSLAPKTVITVNPAPAQPTAVPPTPIPTPEACPASGFVNIYGEPGCTVVVTASPNVVACGGTSIITASVRNQAGHALAGFGYHFATDNGVLTVLPNSATSEYASASLQLLPPGSSGGPATETATVTVSVGAALGTYEQTVTVQQQCSTSAQKANTIALTSSSATVRCGSRVLISGSLTDVSGNPVPDNTKVNLIASSGTFRTGSGSNGASGDVDVSTLGGAFNVSYTAASNASGPIEITAGAGPAFGSITLQAQCGTTGGTGGAAPVPVCIGDNICILPPNTGSAGLRAPR